MALALNTNVGFVATAPTADPAGGDAVIDGASVVTKDTAPAGAVKITQVGWYRGSGTATDNFEIALYANESDVAGTRLFVDATNSSASGGWITTAVDWAITPGTAYWLGLQMDANSGSSTVDSATSGGSGIDRRTGQTTLNDPYGGGAVADADGMYAIYALYNTAPTVVLDSPDDAGSTSDTTPELTFTGTDAEDESITYDIQIASAAFPTGLIALDDDFNDNSLDLVIWPNSFDVGNVTREETGGKIKFTLPISDATGSFNAIRSKSFDFTGKGVHAQLVTTPNAAVASAECWFTLSITNDNKIEFQVVGGTLYAKKTVGGSPTEITSTAYNSSVHKWLRMREDSGTTYWDYSTSGSSWSNLTSQANPITMTSLGFEVGAGLEESHASPGVAEWDNVNVPPLVEGAVSSVDTAAFTGSPDNSDPFASGQAVTYTVQSALSLTTYYWRVKGIDPSGSNTWGSWATARSFTVTSEGGTAVKDIISPGIIAFAR